MDIDMDFSALHAHSNAHKHQKFTAGNPSLFIPRRFVGQTANGGIRTERVPMYDDGTKGVNVRGYHPLTNEKMTGLWFLLHVFAEFLGTALFVFGGTMQCVATSGSIFVQAAAFSSVFVFARSFHRSITLHPFLTITDFIFFFDHMQSAYGILTTVCSILAQIAGGVVGAYLTTTFYRGVSTERVELILTRPREDHIGEYHIIGSEAFISFLMAATTMYIQYKKYAEVMEDLKKKAEEKTNESISADLKPLLKLPEDKTPPPTSTTKIASKEIFSIELQAGAIGTVYFYGIASFGDLMTGAFVPTRAVGPMIALQKFDDIRWVKWYLTGQVIGVTLAAVYIALVCYKHLRCGLGGGGKS